jgi:hypothetical protein
MFPLICALLLTFALYSVALFRTASEAEQWLERLRPFLPVRDGGERKRDVLFNSLSGGGAGGGERKRDVLANALARTFSSANMT